MRYLLFIFSALIFSSCAQSNFTKYSASYELDSIGTVPDYSQLKYWAAHPAKKNPADSVPKSIANNYHPNREADVFFVYPTSYFDTLKPSGWNASLQDIQLNIYTDYTSILNQASIFNEIGKIYAPRYRQAHIQSYTPTSHADTVKALAAFELAYQDVRASFSYFLENLNNGRPIIIASHSQGSTHVKRLLKEFFDDKPLAKRLVTAYVVGMAIDPSDYTQLKTCETPTSTGCICAWRTFREGYLPPFVQKETFKSIVTNPLSWSNKDTLVSRKMNQGSVLYKFNKIVPNVADAINHKGVLWTNKPHFMGSFLLRTSNYHIADFNFYYLSVRKNAGDRLNAFLNKSSN